MCKASIVPSDLMKLNVEHHDVATPPGSVPGVEAVTLLHSLAPRGTLTPWQEELPA